MSQTTSPWLQLLAQHHRPYARVSYLNLLLDVVVPGSESLLDAQLSQLDVNDALVIQFFDVLLSQVTSVVGMVLLILIDFLLPPPLISCRSHVISFTGDI